MAGQLGGASAHSLSYRFVSQSSVFLTLCGGTAAPPYPWCVPISRLELGGRASGSVFSMLCCAVRRCSRRFTPVVAVVVLLVAESGFWVLGRPGLFAGSLDGWLEGTLLFGQLVYVRVHSLCRCVPVGFLLEFLPGTFQQGHIHLIVLLCLLVIFLLSPSGDSDIPLANWE